MLEPASTDDRPIPKISGSLRLLFLYDVCEEIVLDEVRQSLGLQAADRQPAFRHPAPDYVRFLQPPVIVPLEAVLLDSGERLEGRMKYYDYGVVSVEYQVPFVLTWTELVIFTSRWISEQGVEKRSAAMVGRELERIRSAVVKPDTHQLSEDYYVIQVNSAANGEGVPMTTRVLLEQHADEIAQIVRGETIILSDDEKSEVLQAKLSYYPNDLAVVGWAGALIYDTPEGAGPVLQILEYANSQLLEFRHYDELLTMVLKDVYKSLEKGTGFLSRWRLGSEAKQLNTIRLDIRELTERVDNSIKFLSDMFAARLYRLASAKVGVPDYRKLVDEKLNTARELYEFMMDEFHQGRAFVLELMVVLILIVDLVFLFRGKV